MAKYTINIDDPDALAALDAEVARVGGEWTVETFLSDFCDTQFRNMREAQLVAAAQAKVEKDPDLMAFRASKNER